MDSETTWTWKPATQEESINISEIMDMRLSDLISVLHAQGKRLTIKITKIEEETDEN